MWLSYGVANDVVKFWCEVCDCHLFASLTSDLVSLIVLGGGGDCRRRGWGAEVFLTIPCADAGVQLVCMHALSDSSSLAWCMFSVSVCVL